MKQSRESLTPTLNRKSVSKILKHLSLLKKILFHLFFFSLIRYLNMKYFLLRILVFWRIAKSRLNQKVKEFKINFIKIN